MRSIFFLLSFVFLFAENLPAQGMILSNPSACRLNLSIEDNQCPDGSPFFNPNQFGINVTNAPGSALGDDVYLKEVRLVIRHQWAGDLEVRLISPSGKEILLSDDVGGSTDNYGNPNLSCNDFMSLTVDACVALSDQDNTNPPFIDQAYRPFESFLDFNDNVTDPNGLWTLSICDDIEQDTGSLEFVELIFAPLDCLPITDVGILAQDSTSVLINWAPNNDCNEVVTLLEYGPAGFTPGTDSNPGVGGTLLPLSCPPYLLSGLPQETELDIYLRKACSASFTNNSCGLSILTGCLPPGPTTTENFDTESICSSRCERDCELSGLWYNAEQDDIDWIAYSGPTPTQGTGPKADVSRTGTYIYLESSGSACPEDSEAILISDCFELQKRGSDTCHLSFHYYMSGFNVGDLRVEVSDNGGLSWTSIWQRSGPQADNWIKTYLSLNRYADGSIIQVRFVGTKGNGPQGDIALDEITFHGSNHLGRPDNFYYVDNDGDGFGDEGAFVATCLSTPPDGFVNTPGDCNDNNPNINPGAVEIACDFMDNNCNGIEDDADLPLPIVTNDTICSGETPFLTATPVSDKFIFWYTEPSGTNEIPFIGQFFSPDLPPNNTSEPQVYRFYAEETDILCTSIGRVEAVVVVLPRPAGLVEEQISICRGDTIDLASIEISDQNLTGASIAYYSGFPLIEENLLTDTKVSPNGPATYFYQMTSPEGCTFEGSIPIGFIPRPSLSFTPGPTFTLCFESSQEIEVTANGASAPYQYLWNTGAETSSVIADADDEAGSNRSYIVSVTDDNGCTSIDSVVVLTTASIDSVNRSVQDVSFCEGNDGSITIEPLSGVAPFQFSWTSTNGSSGDTIANTAGPITLDSLRQGSYRVTITDGSSKGCTFRMPPVFINGPGAEVLDVDIDDVSCAEAGDGSIGLNVRGNPNFLWNTGANTSTISGLSGGFYSVTVTEGICESILDSIEVQEPEELKVFANSIAPACADSPDGGLIVQAFGGNGNFNYSWSNGGFTPSINGLSSGTYQLSLTDSKNCLLVESFDLEAPSPISISLASSNNISCTGANDGSLEVMVSGGTAPYQYQWSNGTRSSLNNRLGPGQYSLTVTDFNGCSTNASYTILEPSPLRLSTLNMIQPNCLGDTSGVIQVQAIGGRSPYSFFWNNGAQTDSIFNLGVGLYEVYAQDSSGCISDTLNISLDAISNLNLNINAQGPTCEGVANGQIELLPSGVTPFRYEWSTGDTTQMISELESGTFSVTITDGEGCIGDTSVTINPQTIPIEAFFNLLEPNCANSDDGLINVNILSATNQPLTYQWSDGPFIRDRQNVLPGKYQVTITDRIGCTLISDTLEVNTPAPLKIELVSEGSIQCKGDTNGFLELAIDGGAAPYSFNWVGTRSTENAAYNLGAGTYQVFVLDANGCPINSTYRIEEPPVLEVELNVEIGNICIGDSSNLLSLDVAGGMPPYSFLWSNGSRDSVVQNLSPGDYGAVVRDANQCRELLPSIKVREPGIPLQLENFSTEDISCFGARDGSMEVRVDGGTAPYTYIFSNASIFTSNSSFFRVNNLAADNDYRVIVSDAKGCEITSELLTISEPPLLSVRRDSIKDISCAGEADGEVFITPSGGTPPYAYVWLDENEQTVSFLQDLQFAPAGTYRAVVADSRACLDTLRSTTIVDNKIPLEVASLQVENEKCENDQNGSIQVGLTGGTPPYNYSWSNGRNGPEINNLRAGLFSVTVSDAESCRQVIDSIQVIPSSSSLVLIDSIFDVSCFEDTDGAIIVELNGGIPPYQLSWEKESIILALDTNRLSNLAPGVYDLRVVDSIGCAKIFQLEVEEPLPISINFTTENPGETLDDGRIMSLVSGGTPPYQYQWDTGDTIPNLDSLGVGIYTLEIIDSNNCIGLGRVQLITTQILDASVLSEVILFPNPVKDILNLQVKSTELIPDMHFKIFTPQGQLVNGNAFSVYHSITNTTTEEIDVSRLESGQYWLVLFQANGQAIYTSSFIIR